MNTISFLELDANSACIFPIAPALLQSQENVKMGNWLHLQIVFLIVNRTGSVMTEEGWECNGVDCSTRGDKIMKASFQGHLEGLAEGRVSSGNVVFRQRRWCLRFCRTGTVQGVNVA